MAYVLFWMHFDLVIFSASAMLIIFVIHFTPSASELWLRELSVGKVCKDSWFYKIK